VLSELGYFLGLACVIGGSLAYTVVVRPALRRPGTSDDDRAVVRRRAAALLAWSGVLLLVAGYFQLAGRIAKATQGVSYGDALTPGRMAAYLGAPGKPGEWVSTGTLTLAQNVLMIVAAALLVSLFARGAAARVDAVAAWVVPVAVLSTLVLAVPTDLGKETFDGALNAVLDQVHILGATTWLGGVVVLVALALTRRSLSADAGRVWAQVWQRFSALALVAVGSILASGLWLAWKHVGALSELWTTTYGRFLLLKLTLVTGVLVAGAVNQLWLLPVIARAQAAGATGSLLSLTLQRFPKVLAVEVLLGVSVLTIVPFLSGSARAQAGETGGSPVASGSILAIGALLVATLACAFFAAAKASTFAGRRPGTAES
jgi:copper transport protein